MNDRLKPGPKPGLPRRPEDRWADLPLPTLIDLTAGMVVDFQGEPLTVTRRLARSWAVVVATGSIDELSPTTASKYRAIARALEDQDTEAPTPITKAKRKPGRVRKGIASGMVVVASFGAPKEHVGDSNAQVDITRTGGGRRRRRGLAEIFDELRSAA